MDRLKQLGWSEGHNLNVERAYAEGREDRLPELAEELIRRRADVIFAVGPPSAVAAARATKTIPIVFWGVSFPVEHGLVTGIRSPGGNVTGIAFSPGQDLLDKQLQVLKEIAPAARRLAWIHNPQSMVTVSGRAFMSGAPFTPDPRLGFEMRRYYVGTREEFDGVFSEIIAWRADAVGLLGNPFAWLERKRIIEFANGNRIPSTFGMKEFVEAGGLLSYGPDSNETVGQSALYVDKILRGTRPADLPVEQPHKYYFVINLKTAKALGLTIPPSLLLRADQVIE